MLKRLKVETSEVRLPEHLNGLDGLIMPGGESTTFAKLAVAYNLMEPLQLFGQRHAMNENVTALLRIDHSKSPYFRPIVSGHVH